MGRSDSLPALVVLAGIVAVLMLLLAGLMALPVQLDPAGLVALPALVALAVLVVLPVLLALLVVGVVVVLVAVWPLRPRWGGCGYHGPARGGGGWQGNHGEGGR
jgi:hypothetical protein